MQFGPRFTPDIIKWMIGASIGVHLLLMYIAPSLAPWMLLSPALVWEKFAVWQIATAPWVAGDGLALIFEMLALWIFGSELAVRWGQRAFLSYLAYCGIGGTAAMVAFAGGFGLLGVNLGWAGFYPTMSCAIYGVILGYSLMFSDRQVMLFFVVPVRTLYFIPALLFIQLIVGAPPLLWLGNLAAVAIGAAVCWQSGETRLTLQMLLHQFRRWRMRSKLRVLDDAERRRERDRRNLH